MKKYINNQFKFLALLSLAFLTSCEEEYQAVDLVSDVAWFTTEVGSHPDAYELCQGTVVSFMDASQGMKSHQWIIEEGSQFMVNGFDVKSDDIEGQIDPDKTLISEELVENVIFNTPGTTTVTLRNTFYEWVRSHDSSPIEAYVDMENEEWVWEKTFDIEIYGVLDPAFSVSLDGNTILDILAEDTIPTDQSKWATVDVEIGSKITFTDNTTEDRPDGRTWTVANSSEGSSTAATANFSFVTIGQYSGFTLKVTRDKPSESVLVKIPLIVNVTASTADFEVKSLAVDTTDPTAIILNANGSFYAAADGEAVNFTIDVQDSEGNPIPDITIANVEVSESSISDLRLVLSDRLYPGEVATVSYTNSGDGIISTDNRALCSFASKVATNDLVSSNIIDATISSFGSASGTVQNAGWYTESESVTKNLVIKTEAPDDADNYCIMFDINQTFSAAKLYLMHLDFAVCAPVGSYIICYDMWIPESCTTLDSGSLSYSIGYKNDSAAWVDMTPAALYPTLEEGRGKWVTMEYPMEVTEAIASGKIRFSFPSASVPLDTQFYIDNVELYSARPSAE